jgi:hypothetical protein
LHPALLTSEKADRFGHALRLQHHAVCPGGHEFPEIRRLFCEPLPSAIQPINGCGGIAILGLLFKRLKKRRQAHPAHIWILPEPEVSPRLGGAFSAVAGTILFYKQ